MKIGIIGAENSHSVNYAKIINVKKLIPDCQVTHIWGETDAFAQKTAKDGEIETISKTHEELIDQVDAVIITHRRASDHFEPAVKVLEKGLPLFVDKPFTLSSAHGQTLLDMAKKKNIPITSFSNTILQANFLETKKDILANAPIFSLTIHGICEVNGPYNGFYFYGIHHLAMALSIIEDTVTSVYLHNNQDSSCASLNFSNGATAQLIFMNPQWKSGFHIIAGTSQGTKHYPCINDQEIYLAAIQTAVQMFKTKIMPFTESEILEPIKILEALGQSAQTNKLVTIAR